MRAFDDFRNIVAQAPQKYVEGKALDDAINADRDLAIETHDYLKKYGETAMRDGQTADALKAHYGDDYANIVQDKINELAPRTNRKGNIVEGNTEYARKTARFFAEQSQIPGLDVASLSNLVGSGNLSPEDMVSAKGNIKNQRNRQVIDGWGDKDLSLINDDIQQRDIDVAKGTTAWNILESKKVEKKGAVMDDDNLTAPQKRSELEKLGLELSPEENKRLTSAETDERVMGFYADVDQSTLTELKGKPYHEQRIELMKQLGSGGGETDKILGAIQFQMKIDGQDAKKVKALTATETKALIRQGIKEGKDQAKLLKEAVDRHDRHVAVNRKRLEKAKDIISESENPVEISKAKLEIKIATKIIDGLNEYALDIPKEINKETQYGAYGVIEAGAKEGAIVETNTEDLQNMANVKQSGDAHTGWNSLAHWFSEGSPDNKLKNFVKNNKEKLDTYEKFQDSNGVDVFAVYGKDGRIWGYTDATTGKDDTLTLLNKQVYNMEYNSFLGKKSAKEAEVLKKQEADRKAKEKTDRGISDSSHGQTVTQATGATPLAPVPSSMSLKEAAEKIGNKYVRYRGVKFDLDAYRKDHEIVLKGKRN